MAMPDIYAKTTLVIGDGDKDHFYNVFYFLPNSDPTLTADHMQDATDFNEAIYPQLSNPVLAVMGGDVKLKGCNTELHISGGVYSVSKVDGTSGTASGDMHPDYVAVCIQKRTTNPTKSGRGRWFLGPILEANTLEDYIQPINIPSYQTIAAAWGESIEALDVIWDAQLFSKKNETLTTIQSTYVNPKLATIVGRKSHSIL